jgi:hypothetical protein
MMDSGQSLVPEIGKPYPSRAVGRAIMLAAPSNVVLCINYLDEDGVEQERWFSPGVWPVKSTQVNGYATMRDREPDVLLPPRVIGNTLYPFLRTAVSGADFQITVLI